MRGSEVMELYWWIALTRVGFAVDVLSGFAMMISWVLFGWVFFVSQLPKPTSDFKTDFTWTKPYRYKMLRTAIFLTILQVAVQLIPTRTDVAIMYGWDALKSDHVEEVIEILKDKIR